MRALDVFPMSPSGVAIGHLHFLEAFLILCLLEDSPSITPDEQWAIEYNELTIALRGREPALRLIQGGRRVAASEWANEIFNAMVPICEILDQHRAGNPYQNALIAQRTAIADMSLLPSAQILHDIRAAHQTFFEFGLSLSKQHARHFRDRELPPAVAEQFRTIAEDSVAEQQKIEASDNLTFEDFLARYFAGQRLS
jgi:glutamate--cysteine ligase